MRVTLGAQLDAACHRSSGALGSASRLSGLLLGDDVLKLLEQDGATVAELCVPLEQGLNGVDIDEIVTFLVNAIGICRCIGLQALVGGAACERTADGEVDAGTSLALDSPGDERSLVVLADGIVYAARVSVSQPQSFADQAT